MSYMSKYASYNNCGSTVSYTRNIPSLSLLLNISRIFSFSSLASFLKSRPGCTTCCFWRSGTRAPERRLSLYCNLGSAAQQPKSAPRDEPLHEYRVDRTSPLPGLPLWQLTAQNVTSPASGAKAAGSAGTDEHSSTTTVSLSAWPCATWDGGACVADFGNVVSLDSSSVSSGSGASLDAATGKAAGDSGTDAPVGVAPTDAPSKRLKSIRSTRSLKPLGLELLNRLTTSSLSATPVTRATSSKLVQPKASAISSSSLGSTMGVSGMPT
mmetsp:Transcript_115415/g.288440  ORF Transcript_115415/g.288440 Transcript_115415/m.288440 type:complete len:268 (+) Transcript_115415:294-1097(+)